MHDEDVPPCPVQPRQDYQLISATQVRKALAYLFFENQPGGRRAFISLPGRLVQRLERGFDPADRFQLESSHRVSHI